MNLVGLQFTQASPSVDETIYESEHQNPIDYVKRMAQSKCETIVAGSEIMVIAADTIVYFDNMIFGKPKDRGEAGEYLKRLSGQTHHVYTGVAVCMRKKMLLDHAVSTVTFKQLTEEEITDYIQTEEPLDKAGGYGIQGYGAQFIERIEGCYFNVMGFPVNLFYKMVAEF